MATYIVPIIPVGATPGYAIVVAGVPGTRVTTGFTFVSSGELGDNYQVDIATALPFTIEWQYTLDGWATVALILDTMSATSTGLTAQQTRDAMKLSPSAGVQPVDGIDGKLNVLVPGAAIVLNDDETTIVVNS